MEWQMVWKDVTIGFTVAGIIAAFVPRSFFQALFLGSGEGEPVIWQLVAQAFIRPAAAFFTFIGSMGNVPLAAVLYSNGVSFAGIMAFIFSDLVVFPVLRVQASYYGWRMAAYILGVFLVVLVAASLILHFGFSMLGLLPDASQATSVTERNFFAVDYTLFLNLGFLLLSAVFVVWKARAGVDLAIGDAIGDRILLGLALFALAWLAGGLVVPAIV